MTTQAPLFGDLFSVDYNAPLHPPRRVMLASGSEHWCTHPEQLAVIEQFAPIAFDPFSNPHSLVRAQRAVMLPEDSLLIDWPREGLCFCNPPYGEELGPCAEKIAREAGQGSEIITLVPARVDTGWWRALSPVLWCAWTGRLKFLETLESLHARHSDRCAKAQKAGLRPPPLPRCKMVSDTLAESEAAPFAVALCYHGKRLTRFAEIFGRHGKIYAEVNS